MWGFSALNPALFGAGPNDGFSQKQKWPHVVMQCATNEADIFTYYVIRADDEVPDDVCS
jgi:hypothetical protein